MTDGKKKSKKFGTHHVKNKFLKQGLKNKKIPEEIRSVVEEALSYFPELAEVSIDFRFKKSIKGSFMQAQPIFRSILRSRKRRNYKINISRFLVVEGDPIPIREIPKRVLVGWLGHELGHVMDYLHRSSFNMFEFAFGYLFSKSFLIGAERTADIYAMEHGLAKHILEAKNFILNHSSLPERYKKKIKKYYMSPDEVLLFVEGELDIE